MKEIGKVGLSHFFLVSIIALSILEKSLLPAQFFGSTDKPNIILIGFDSLRPDYINSETMPFLSQKLQIIHTFKIAYTPLARTLPAWISILTGQYPKHTHVRVNLGEDVQSSGYQTLPQQLKKNGYETFYSTDESRYTDITRAHGFDHIIAPKGGVVEFLLGTLTDFPVNNLLLRLPGIRWLFPYNYGNRAAEFTYYPQDYLNRFRFGLRKHTHQPIFLAMHLTLSHWPFIWANSRYDNDALQRLSYQASLREIDDQFKKIYSILKQSGALNHALLFYLSDHGVTLGEQHDRSIDLTQYHGDEKKLSSLAKYKLASAAPFTLNHKDFSISTSYGQGTDVLSLPQYQILMAFESHGAVHPSLNTAIFTSLLDITPTVLDFLKIPHPTVDGQSWFKPRKKQPFFIETADIIDGMETDKIDTHAIAKKALGIYEITQETGLVRLKKSAYPALLKNKQRAMIDQDWMLAYYPAKMRKTIEINNTLSKKLHLQYDVLHNQFKTISKNKSYPLHAKIIHIPPYYVLLNLKNHLWTLDMQSEFAKSSPLKTLQQKFCQFYGDEITCQTIKQ